jgi:hypothetical protein
VSRHLQWSPAFPFPAWVSVVPFEASVISFLVSFCFCFFSSGSDCICVVHCVAVVFRLGMQRICVVRVMAAPPPFLGVLVWPDLVMVC